MLIKPPLSDQDIIDCLSTSYGIKVSILILLPLGADINASVYKAETHDQLSYFVKLKRGHHHRHDIGIAVVELLHNAGIKEIIPPVKTIHSNSTQLIVDFTLIVYPFIEGENGFSRTLTEEQCLTLGKILRKIHEIDVPSSLKQRIRRETYSSQSRDIVRSLYTSIETQQIGNEISLKLWAFMKKNARIIHRLIDRAEQLAKILQDQSPKFVLCHSDIHAGNVLIDKNNNLYIVDWDDPIMAPQERDLMFIGGGIGNIWNKSQEEALFYQSYGNIKINMALLTYYRHERIVEDIAEYGQDLFLTAAGGENRAEMYKHFVAMFEPNGVVDIAFKTNKDIAL